MVLAHNFGVTTVEEGRVDEENALDLSSSNIGEFHFMEKSFYYLAHIKKNV